MQDFSIELTAERIVDPRSRSYFREVFTSYVNDNRRSATVMLWSVVICDLLFKLEDLRASFADGTATTLLTEVEARRASSPRSPDWELWLLDEIKARTKLLDDHEYQALKEIQLHRHLAAHPILTAQYELHSPTPEAVRADIRAALECVLTKPPLMTKKVFNAIVEDLEARQSFLVDDDSLRKYLDAKFFAHLLPAVSREVFKSLWQVVFVTIDDPKAVANRRINFRALCILFDRNAEEALRMIEADRKRFSRLAPDQTVMRLLVEFLALRPRIFDHLTDEAKSPIRDFAATKPAGILAWFAFPGGIKGQIAKMRGGTRPDLALCSPADFERWLEIAENEGVADEVASLAVEAYVGSPLYDPADLSFRLVSLSTPWLTKEHLLRCLKGIEANNQTYGRGRARSDHRELKAVCDRVLGPEFDYSPFPRFAGSIGEPS